MAITSDPLSGMSEEQYVAFEKLPSELREAYAAWFRDRKERRAAHRDTLEAFVAGWHLKPAPAAPPPARDRRPRSVKT